MKNIIKIFFAIVVSVLVIIFIYFNKDNIVNKIVSTEDIKGCYVAHLANDIYSLKISNQNGKDVEGTLVFYNAEKDSSYGAFKGTYVKGILYGTYSFRSEGMDSVMDVIFKKVTNGFQRGYRNTEDGVKLIDIPNVTYDPKYTFEPASNCATSLQGNL
jgi:hypothetical protein